MKILTSIAVLLLTTGTAHAEDRLAPDYFNPPECNRFTHEEFRACINRLWAAHPEPQADDPKSTAEIHCQLLKLDGKDYQSCLDHPGLWTSPEAPYSDEDAGWPVTVKGDWDCGKIRLRRTSQKATNHGGWISFHLYSCDGKFCPPLPRKITLKHEYDYDTHTDRVTINGKPCRQANSVEAPPPVVRRLTK